MDISRLYNLSPGQVSKIIASPLFVAEIERLESLAEYEAVDVRTELEMRQGLSVKTLDKILLREENDHRTLALQKDVALEILDRTGYGKKAEVQKHAHLHLHKDVSDMDDDELYEAAIDAISTEGDG